MVYLTLIYLTLIMGIYTIKLVLYLHALINFLSANLYSHEKMKPNCVEKCKNETKLN